MAIYLCATARGIKEKYESNQTRDDSGRAADVGRNKADRLAMARALNGHMSRCKECST